MEALRYLATYHKSRMELGKAQAYAQRLLDFSGSEQEEAKRLLIEIEKLS